MPEQRSTAGARRASDHCLGPQWTLSELASDWGLWSSPASYAQTILGTLGLRSVLEGPWARCGSS